MSSSCFAANPRSPALARLAKEQRAAEVARDRCVREGKHDAYSFDVFYRQALDELI